MTLRELITQLEAIISEGTPDTTEVDRILPAVKSPGIVVAIPSGEDSISLRLARVGGNQVAMMARLKEKVNIHKPPKVKE
jgi:hypothetical protein